MEGRFSVLSRMLKTIVLPLWSITAKSQPLGLHTRWRMQTPSRPCSTWAGTGKLANSQSPVQGLQRRLCRARPKPSDAVEAIQPNLLQASALGWLEIEFQLRGRYANTGSSFLCESFLSVDIIASEEVESEGTGCDRHQKDRLYPYYS